MSDTETATDPSPLSGHGARFLEAVKICFRKYASGQSRAPRWEYWYFVLFTLLAQIAGPIVDEIFGLYFDNAQKMGVMTLIFFLVIAIPSITVLIRRLHDVNRSGWWWLIVAIPLVGALVLLWWTLTRGTVGENRFGPDPLAA